MNMTPEFTARCPNCGRPLSPHASQGLCRACLAAATLESPAASDLGLAAQPGQQIGEYRLLEIIDQGGFGVVFLAQKEGKNVNRVALKIFKRQPQAKARLPHLDQEAKAMASLQHDHIAKVYDADVTPDGDPYLVMELVPDGQPLTKFCAAQRLPLDERLRLMISVCQAIQYLHTNRIVHRDIKPSNILASAEGGVTIVKIIDFGIALVLGDEAAHQMLLAGTPGYMSPEQAQAGSGRVDTRSDLYSLGVLLDELISGTHPFDSPALRSTVLDERLRAVCQSAPTPPSTRLAALAPADLARLATERHLKPKQFLQRVRGDLDAIVAKCLQKNPDDRYATAQELAQDLERHLKIEPVLACAPSAAYRLQKLVRRNKGAFAAAAAVFFALLAGLGVAAWQAVRANRTLNELRSTAPAFAEQARSLVSTERFEEAVEKLAYASRLRPDVPEYHLRRGDLLQCQFQFAEAKEAYRQALQLRPHDSRAITNVALCDDLLAAPRTPEGKLTRESLSRLHVAMQKQQRPAAELMPVARLLGVEKKVLFDYWVERLKHLPTSAENPIAKRLTVQDDGRLALDLNRTQVTDLSPLAGMPLGSLDLRDCAEFADLAPLQAIPSLTRLSIRSTAAIDLSPLQNLKLEELNVAFTKVFDLAPLRGMALKKLSLSSSSVTDLSPLVGAPLRDLDLSFTPVQDIAPLAGLPLEKLDLRRCRVTDLGVLRRMPLKELVLWGCAQARNYAGLTEIKSLESLFLPDNIRTLPADERAAIARLRDQPNLHQLGTDFMGGYGEGVLGTAQAFWQEWDRDAKFLEALNRGEHIEFIGKLPGGTYFLVCHTNFTDLSILADAPVTQLSLHWCAIADLAPIRNLKLTVLNLGGTPVSDLSPLRDMPLDFLDIDATRVSDLSPLTRSPLRTLHMTDCPNLTNVAVLAEVSTLEYLSLPISAHGVETLRGLPKLKRIGFDLIGVALGRVPLPCCTTEVFWKTWDGLKWARALEAVGMKFSAKQRADGCFSVSVQTPGFTDGTVFRGANLCEVNLSQTDATDVSPLAECNMLEQICLPPNAKSIEFLRRQPKLQRLSFQWDPKLHRPCQTTKEFWAEYDSQRTPR